MEQVLQSLDSVLNTVWVRLTVGVAIIAVLTIGVVLLVQWKRQRTLLGTMFGQAADSSFYAHIDAVTHAFDEQTATATELRALCAELEQTSHGFFDTVDIERYDAFPGQAGRFSFSLLLLNRNQCGAVLTSLTGTTGSKMYVKRIEHGKSDVALSREEQDVLARHAQG